MQELKMQDSDVLSYLPPVYKKVLENADQARAEFKEQPKNLEHLVTIARDQYQDFCKLTGIPAQKQRVQKLEQLLLDARTSLEEVLEFILS
ncbi:hypothetical protein DUNSADRAFT_6562 [Dunaliella salina]|uniref:BBS7 helical hairpin domain-containing protein n=1 Tax=Dunaliella salina TaxID=3046 RepID=A0ABQ7GN51_DUNSA|nr:hypothetical protein DUNSADRAFT_6562 [Dunaliella salina]|eukprot:KAF5836041.1 hypothetical protein DUNSADRAFT_6562 [Dunaliella salina]